MSTNCAVASKGNVAIRQAILVKSEERTNGAVPLPLNVEANKETPVTTDLRKDPSMSPQAGLTKSDKGDTLNGNPIEGSAKPILKIGRKQPYTSPILTPNDIAQEILARAEKKRQNFPDGVDVLVAMKSPSKIRIPLLQTPPNPLQNVPSPSVPKVPKLRDENKSCLDANELLMILQGGAEGHYVEKPKPLPKPARVPRNKDLKLDPELEKELALKQLLEFSRKKGRSKKDSVENNNNSSISSNTNDGSSGSCAKTNSEKEKPKKKETKKNPNRELQKLLQDEGAINMLYQIEKGECETKEKLSSKRRMKKVLKRKAQEVEEAILEATTSSANSPRLRAAQVERIRKASVDSLESDVGQDFTFTSPAEASKIIRRHSSSSSYSSRGSSPLRLSVDFDKSPIKISDFMDTSSSTPLTSHKRQSKISERAEKLIEMKCKELNLQPEHSDMIKQLIQDKKNGLKERLQTQFTNKFKAAAALTPSTPPKAHKRTCSTSPSPAKKVLQMVEEDWDTGDELSDTDSLKRESEVKKEAPPLQIVSSDPPAITPLPGLTHTASVIKANFVAALKNTLTSSTPLAMPVPRKPTSILPSNETEVPISAVTIPSLPTSTNDIGSSSLKQNITSSIPRPSCGPYPGSEVRIERHDTVVRINITPTTSHLVQAMNCKVMTELYKALEYLEVTNEETRVIVLSCPSSTRLAEKTTSEPWVYCNGVDLPSLLEENPESRRIVASNTAVAIKELVTKLAMEGRPILTAVSGQAVGLGVVLLGYCDYVMADDTATFYTPYGRLGYLPEGAATLVLPQIVGQRRAGALLVGATKMNARDAETCGLISQIVPSDCLEKRIMELARDISNYSLQSSKSTKALLMHSIRTRLPVVLATEVKLLEQHWSSDECQNRIRDLVANPIF